MRLQIPEERKRLFLIAGSAAAAILVAIAVVALLPSSKRSHSDPDPQINLVNDLAKSKDLEGLKQSALSAQMSERAAALAVQAYAQCSGTSGAATVQQFLADRRPFVRAEAAHAWASVSPHHDRASIGPIVQLISKDASPQVREAGLQALAAIESWDALPAVLDRLLDDKEEVRRTAMGVFEKVAFIRISNDYHPQDLPEKSRPLVDRLRAWQAKPGPRQLYVEYWKSKGVEN